jgi:hypothetical protein
MTTLLTAAETIAALSPCALGLDCPCMKVHGFFGPTCDHNKHRTVPHASQAYPQDEHYPTHRRTQEADGKRESVGERCEAE